MTIQELYTDLLSKQFHAHTKQQELRDAAEDEYNEGMRFDEMRDWESADEHYALYDDYTEEADQWEKERDAYDDMLEGLRRIKEAQEVLGLNIKIEVEA